MNLDECDRLMQKRDHLAVVAGSDFDRDRVRTALADEVPGLVAEVRRLNLQKDELEAQVTKWRGELNGSEVALAKSLLRERGMVEERDLYSDVVDAAETWLKHHGKGGVDEAEANKALRYQVERLGEKVPSEKPKGEELICALCYHPIHDGACLAVKRKCPVLQTFPGGGKIECSLEVHHPGKCEFH